jgi:3-dehydroquinate dehydratase-2
LTHRAAYSRQFCNNPGQNHHNHNRYDMASILVLNGPNLNLLGTREPAVYGATTLADINARLVELAKAAGHHLQTLQSNAEAELIERIHAARQEGIDFIIINPAAFTHTSVALRDALLGVAIPFIEVHLSNVHAREAFRHHSYFSDIAVGTIVGLGALGYELALQAALHKISQ